MLTVTRKVGQAVRVGGNVRVALMEVRGKKIRRGIEAPEDVQLLREEVSDEERERYRLGAGEG